MVNRYYYTILNIKPKADFSQIKEAYYREAKRNHPDLFPDEKKEEQQLHMMKINEAYMALIHAAMRDEGGDGPDNEQPDAWEIHPQLKNQIGRLKDPAYTYYRLGFTYYRYAYTELYRKDPRIIRKQLAELKSYDAYLLKLVIKALQHFERSYTYFLEVVNSYPDSVWYSDSRAKLRKIEKFSVLYHRICENLSRNLKKMRLQKVS